MAESWRAKAKRYARGDFTNAELKIIIGGMLADQVIDVATFGAVSRLKGKAFVRVALPLVKRAGMMAGRAVVSTGGTGLGVGRLVMRNPYLLGGAAIYVGYQERERIKQLLDQGYEFVEERLPTPSPPPLFWYTRRGRDHHRRNGKAPCKRIHRRTPPNTERF